MLRPKHDAAEFARFGRRFGRCRLGSGAGQAAQRSKGSRCHGSSRRQIRHVWVNRHPRCGINPGGIACRLITLPAFAAARFFAMQGLLFAFFCAGYVDWLWWCAHIVPSVWVDYPVPFGSGQSVYLGIGVAPFAAGLGCSSAIPSTSRPVKSGAAALSASSMENRRVRRDDGHS